MAAATPGFSSAPIVGEGHRPSRDVTPDTEVRWFHGITGGSMPRPAGAGNAGGEVAADIDSLPRNAISL